MRGACCDSSGKTIVYATDVELDKLLDKSDVKNAGKLLEEYREFIHGADLQGVGSCVLVVGRSKYSTHSK